MVRRESNLSARHPGPTFIFQNQLRKTSLKVKFLNRLASKAAAKVQQLFLPCKTQSKIFEIYFQTISLQIHTAHQRGAKVSTSFSLRQAF
jgi:hypothetical protein